MSGRSIDWKARAVAAEREVRRLRKIEHAAWHALDDAAEYPEENRIKITRRDWKALCKLLPLEHSIAARKASAR